MLSVRNLSNLTKEEKSKRLYKPIQNEVFFSDTVNTF